MTLQSLSNRCFSSSVLNIKCSGIVASEYSLIRRRSHLSTQANSLLEKNKNNRLVLGCGSNVVDYFFKVKSVPNSGEKGYFKSPTQILERTVVGGVTLNHLAW